MKVSDCDHEERLIKGKSVLEAASPGELKSGGDGWTMTAGFAESPFGRCLVALSPRGFCHLSFVDPGEDKAEWSALQSCWPRAQWRREDKAVSRLIGRVFTRESGSASKPMPRVFVRGTAFQIRVWRALMQVKPGTLVSYSRLAAAIGRPNAARAVGTAVARNPVAYLIPCHRVIRETGAVGNYRWGSVRKRAILAWESRLIDLKSVPRRRRSSGTSGTALRS